MEENMYRNENRNSAQKKITGIIVAALFLLSLWTPGRVMAQTITDPEPPTILEPVGEIVTDTLALPRVKWTHIEGAHAYTIWLNSPSFNYPVKEYYYPKDLNPGDVISLQLDSMGQEIHYGVRYGITILAMSDYFTDFGDPNDQYDFNVQSEAHFTLVEADQSLNLSPPVGISPNGTTESNPVTLSWQAEPGAARYWLWVDNLPYGKEWDDTDISPAEAGCAGGSGTCAYTLPVDLTEGDKAWWILAFDSQGGNSGWSSSLNFTLQDGGSGVGIPGKGVGIFPNGQTLTNLVTFTWQADPAAARYWLWVDNSGGGLEWDDDSITPQEAGCVSGTGNCVFTIPANLTDGDKVWWILPIGPQGKVTAWSDPLYFQIDDGGSGSVPGQGVGISPDGTIESNPVTLTWQADPAAAFYYLWVDQAGIGLEWRDETVTPQEAGCASGTGDCAYTLPVSLTDGDKVWWVLPIGPQGEVTAWSEPLFFNVGGGNGDLPGQGVLISPVNITIGNPVTLSWQMDPQATRYQLVLLSDEDALLDIWLTSNEAGCLNVADTCSYTLSTLNDGTYAWRILPSNNAGDGLWSPRTDFTVNDGGSNPIPGQAVGIHPNDTAVENPVILSWEIEPHATQYMLWIDDLNNGTVAWSDWVTAAQAGCAGQSDACAFSTPITLQNGNYQWWVQAGNNQGVGPWSNPLPFSVGGGNYQTPGDAQALSPNQVTVANPITFSWRQFATLPTHFRLTIEPGGIFERFTWEQAACTMSGDDADCTYTLPYALNDGDYTWQLQPEINGVYGNQTPPTAFTVLDGGNQLPGVGVGISPDGTTETNPVTLVWQADPYGARYYLWVDFLDAGDYWADDTITASQAGCASGSGSCSFTLPMNLNDGQYQWWVMPINSHGDYTGWSSPLFFLVGGNQQTPAQPVGESPINTTAENPIQFFWQQALEPSAETFQLQVTYPNSQTEIETFDHSDVICAPLDDFNALCNYTLPWNLNDGAYSWQLRAANNAGYSPWSPGYNFTVGNNPGQPPGQVTLVNPINTTVSNPVLFEWLAQPAATEYNITVEADGGGVFAIVLSASETNCGAGTGTCSWSDTLAETGYTWTVTARNENGSGTVSDPATFTVDDTDPQVPQQPVPLSPKDEAVANPITFSWQQGLDPMPSGFQLHIETPDGNNKTETFTFDQANCNLPGNNSTVTCAYTLPYDLINGDHVWQITATLGNGNFNWSPHTNFTVDDGDPEVPQQPVPLSPKNETVANPITFSWQQGLDPMPTGFQLYIETPDGNNKKETFSFGEAECATTGGPATCHYALPYKLIDGNYVWQITATLGNGYVNWSPHTDFKVGQVPGKGVGISPDGTEVVNPVTFTWQMDPHATEYQLVVEYFSQIYLDVTITAADAGCRSTSETCSYENSTKIPAGAFYIWKVCPKNSLGKGEWSDPLSFSIPAIN
jgi:hypothetical protein